MATEKPSTEEKAAPRRVKLLTSVRHNGESYEAGSVHDAEALGPDLLDTLLTHGSAEYHNPEAASADADLSSALSAAQAANAELREKLAAAQQEIVRLKARTGEEAPQSEADKRRGAGG